MSEPNGNSEILPIEEQQKIDGMRVLIRKALGNAAEAVGQSILGRGSAEATERTEVDPFTGNVLEFVMGVELFGRPSKWNEEKMRGLYEGLTETLPEDATDDQVLVQQKALRWLESAAREKDNRAGNTDGAIARYVATGERAHEPIRDVPITGADSEDFETQYQEQEARLQAHIAKIRREKKDAETRAKERVEKGELITPEEARRQEHKTQEWVDRITNSELVENFDSAEEVVAAAREMASRGRLLSTDRTHDERIVSAETQEETDALPDYHEEKIKLMQELADVKTGIAEHAPTWEEYGWANKSQRGEIKRFLTTAARLKPEQAEELMAAALLHGQTAESFSRSIERAFDPQQGKGLTDYLESSGIMRDDDHVFSFAIPDSTVRQDWYENMMVNRPGDFEGTIWQMAHAPGANIAFREGNAMALYRNVVVRKFENGKMQLRTEQRVNVDNVMEWLEDRMLEAHGNNTTRALDFENEVQIQKSGMGLPIKVYDMMLARTDKMFISKYLTDTNGNPLRFGWVADMYEAITNILAESRSAGIVIPQKMRGDLQELIAERLRSAIVSNMTRDIGGTSLSEQQRKLSEHGNGRQNADGKKGAVIDTCYMAYCSFYDTEKLAYVLGYDHVDELGEIFNLKNIQAVGQGIVDGLVGKAKEKYREEFGDEPNYWLNLKKGAKLNNVEIQKVFNMNVAEDDPRYGIPLFLDRSLSPGERFKAEASFRALITFLNSMSPDARVEKVIKKIITKRAKEIHGMASTINGAEVAWRDDLIEMQADGMLYRFGTYFHMDNKLEVDDNGHVHTNFSSRSEEAKLNAGFREHYNQTYGSGGNLFNLQYFPNSMLPEALALRTRNGEIYQNVIEAAVTTRLEISKKAVKEADTRFAREEAEYNRAKQVAEARGESIDTVKAGILYQAYLDRKKKIERVGSMKGRTADDIDSVAKSEILAEEVSRIITTSTARTVAEERFSRGELDATYQQRRTTLAASSEMRGRSASEIDAAAKRQIIAEEEKRVGVLAPEAKVAPITAYNEAAQMFQFDGEAERTWGTENYKNAFNFARELAFPKEFSLQAAVTQGPEGPSVNLTKFIETFSKRATEIHKTFKNLDMSKLIDAWDRYADPPRMRRMTVAEYMIGPKVLAAMGLLVKGDDNSSETIAGRIKEKKYKQKDYSRFMMAALVAGEVQLFREWADWNLSPRYSFSVTMGILEAIGRMPGGKDAKGNWIPYFGPEHMEFIRKESDTGLFKRYAVEFLSNFFFGTRGKKDGFFAGLAEMFATVFKASFQGVAAA